MDTEVAPVFRLEDYRPTDFAIDHVHLTFRLDPTETIITSRLTMRRRPDTAVDAVLALDGDELEFLELRIDGNKTATTGYTVTPQRLEISSLPVENVFSLEIRTRIAPDCNSKLMGLYRSNGVYCTQCEAEGFRRLTYFLDRPDVLAVYTTRLEARVTEAPLLLSNGNPADRGKLDDEWHFAEWHDPHPKPSYLFALVAGDLETIEDHFVTRSGRDVDLRIFVEKGKADFATYAMDALKRSMRWDEERFGREYDLDIFMIVAVSDFNMGAMENKGLNIFNDKYVLADPETATDVDYVNIEAIIAHEYFHNWTGNRITCRDWFQLCLKEGLTVYRDHEFSADMHSRAVKRITEVRMLKAHQFPEDSGPLAHPVRPEHYSEINNFYTATVYEKGSEVIRMLAVLLGQDGFRKGLDLYFDRHDGEAATVEQFLRCFEDATHTDLTQFALWYRQAGTPSVTVSTRYDPKLKTFTVLLEQTVAPTPGQDSKKPMHIPLSMALFNPRGASVPNHRTSATGDVIHLTERRQEVTYRDVDEIPVLSINRGFSAPINVRFEQPSRELALLAQYETDPFSRWQALNRFAGRSLIAATRCIKQGDSPEIEPLLIESMVATLRDDALEPALRAHALTLPGETDIARDIGTDIDPDAIHAARSWLRRVMAKAGAQSLAGLVETLRPRGSFVPDADGAGRRALFLVALRYLSLNDGNPDLAMDAFRDADNMTILSGALEILAHDFPDSDPTRQALESFEKRFANNPLVLDKWLSVQATIPRTSTLERIHELMRAKHFRADNPNRVRALLGSFFTANPIGFNDRDGRGYAFLAEQILELDKSNPQLAARLLTAMRSWQSLETVRRDKAREALLSIAAARSLSTDVRDIVDRMFM